MPRLKIDDNTYETLRNALNEHDIDIDNLKLTRKDINSILNPNSLFNALMNEGYAHDVLSVRTGGQQARESRLAVQKEIRNAKSLREITQMYKMINRVNRNTKTKKFASDMVIYTYMEGLIKS